MAVRPLVTTGVVLASAGAIIAATPGLMTPPNIAIAASDAEAVASKKSITVSELNLLALSDIDIQTISDIFFRVDGWGGNVGGTYDPYYGGSTYGLNELYVQVGQDENGDPLYARALNAEGQALNAYLDEDGNPKVGDADIYVADEDGNLQLVNGDDDEPVYGTAPISGPIYRDGLVGLAYYLGDQLLDEVAQSGVPLISDAAAFMYNNVTSYFYEGGVEETIRVVASELTGGPNGLVGQALATVEDLSHNWLAYTGVVLTLAASGVPLAGPDLAAATSIFFFGGPLEDGGKEYNQGIDGIINYVVDRVLGAPAPGSEVEPPEAESDVASAKGRTAMLASADKALPALNKLISLDLKADNGNQIDADSAKLVKTLEVTDEAGVPDATAQEGNPETVTSAVEVSKPESPKLELPKLPKLNIGSLVPRVEEKAAEEVKLPAAEEQSSEAPKSTEDPATEQQSVEGEKTDTGATTKAPNKFAPKSSTTERKKSAGERFVENATKNLEKAFKPTTKVGADKQDTAKGAAATGASAKGASGGDSSAHAGNAHADNKDSKSNDTKGNKDNKDSKSHKDK
ncbi:hypothetical protein H8Z59_06500 [Mycolicibacterium fortuitum]|uniref:hypothetical protein n=1 Tax=Mycolicibacterium fortuitum TaxID=1766 RepID=UPI001CDD4539|nr:hypothetical protein [Mycolicibacterium fortuitum]UBV22808.1 hypothetical protein H8Z59_06500 [Mycolicibacterium fortuitum]